MKKISHFSKIKLSYFFLPKSLIDFKLNSKVVPSLKKWMKRQLDIICHLNWFDCYCQVLKFNGQWATAVCSPVRPQKKEKNLPSATVNFFTLSKKPKAKLRHQSCLFFFFYKRQMNDNKKHSGRFPLLVWKSLKSPLSQSVKVLLCLVASRQIIALKGALRHNNDPTDPKPVQSLKFELFGLFTVRLTLLPY